MKIRFQKSLINQTKFLFGIFFVCFLSGCEDKFQKGFEAGYAEGVQSTEKRMSELVGLLEEKIRRLESKNNLNTSSTYTTEVCGGSGVDVNGTHHSSGKSGCVRVYSDGRIEKY